MNKLNGNQDRVSLGIYRPDYTITTNTSSEETILTEFRNMLEKGGSTVKVVPEIQRVKFAKNFWNLSFSTIATLVGYRLPAIFRAPPKNGEAYEPYVSDTTKRYIDDYTIPNIRAVLEEALMLGAYLLICTFLYR
jgi:2-dehydropantoate 2-reductase